MDATIQDVYCSQVYQSKQERVVTQLIQNNLADILGCNKHLLLLHPFLEDIIYFVNFALQLFFI